MFHIWPWCKSVIVLIWLSFWTLFWTLHFLLSFHDPSVKLNFIYFVTCNGKFCFLFQIGSVVVIWAKTSNNVLKLIFSHFSYFSFDNFTLLVVHFIFFLCLAFFYIVSASSKRNWRNGLIFCFVSFSWSLLFLQRYWIYVWCGECCRGVFSSNIN